MVILQYRIMFVCHGNICRSPMAEFIMKNMVKDKGLSESFFIASSATSTEEIGNPVYPPAQRELKRHGLSPAGKFAVQLKSSDYDKYDIFAVMDENNLRNIRRIFPNDPLGKIHKLLEYTGSGRDVADPWYSGDFETAYNDIYSGCAALLDELLDER